MISSQETGYRVLRQALQNVFNVYASAYGFDEEDEIFNSSFMKTLQSKECKKQEPSFEKNFREEVLRSSYRMIMAMHKNPELAVWLDQLSCDKTIDLTPARNAIAMHVN
jgi:hypothetical protein